MLTPFPELLMLSFFAPFFLRVALGLVLFITAFHQIVDQKYQSKQRFVTIWPKYGEQFLWTASTIEIIIGLSFVAGFYTQYAALVAITFALYASFSKKYQKATERNVLFYILMLAISISLLLTGAGIFAYDIPL